MREKKEIKPRKDPANAPRLAASKRFGKYKKEKKRETRKADVTEAKTPKCLERVWKDFDERWQADSSDTDWKTADALYPGLCVSLQETDYSARDVERFAIALASLKTDSWMDSRPGVFLSALVNTGKERDYTLHLEHLDFKVAFLAHKNTKNLTIYGIAEEPFASYMSDGRVVLNGGHAASVIGYCMSGGTLLINGDAGADIGSNMTGGMIHVKGNAGASIGDCITGGTIIIEGKARSVGTTWTGLPEGLKGNGRIYINGNLDMAGDLPEGTELYLKGKLIFDGKRWIR